MPVHIYILGPNPYCWDGIHSRWYTGNISVTKSGRKCQFWSAQYPHQHSRNRTDLFHYDKSVEDAKNYCRDPDMEGTPWCYTTYPNKRWEHCDIPLCKNRKYAHDSMLYTISIENNLCHHYRQRILCIITISNRERIYVTIECTVLHVVSLTI